MIRAALGLSGDEDEAAIRPVPGRCEPCRSDYIKDRVRICRFGQIRVKGL
jgi:hypothetical protein